MKEFRKQIKIRQDYIEQVEKEIVEQKEKQHILINRFIQHLLIEKKFDPNWNEIEEGSNPIDITLGSEDFTVHITIDAHLRGGIQSEQCHNPNEDELVVDATYIDMVTDIEGMEMDLSEETERILKNTFA